MNQTGKTFEYEAVGYTANPNDPSIVSSIVVKDCQSGIVFNATILEAQRLVKEDKLYVPGL